MWVYRIDKTYHQQGFTISMETAEQTYLYRGSPAIKIARDAVLELCRHIDWDGTQRDGVKCFYVPGVNGMALGFIFQDVAGRTFICSPFHLAHLERALDWDAYTSHEEIERTRRTIRTHGAGARPEAHMTKNWQVSKRGNLFGQINGANVTVFAADGGYKAIINPINRQPITTRKFSDNDECCEYVLKHFYDIIDPPDTSGGLIADDETDW